MRSLDGVREVLVLLDEVLEPLGEGKGAGGSGGGGGWKMAGDGEVRIVGL